MKQLVDELNEKDKQGKEQLMLEAANSFSNAYAGFSKEDFYSFMAKQYMNNAEMINTNVPGSPTGEEEDK